VKDTLLTEHNRLRALEGVPPVEWDDNLAE